MGSKDAEPDQRRLASTGRIPLSRALPAGHLRIPAIAASAIAALAALTGASAAVASDWLPVSAEEVAMTSVPEAPNVPAVYLYRQVDRNDEASTEYEYRRIKILTEEGRKYADVKITMPSEYVTFPDVVELYL